MVGLLFIENKWASHDSVVIDIDQVFITIDACLNEMYYCQYVYSMYIMVSVYCKDVYAASNKESPLPA
jgi:hypothetical protein